MFIITWQVEGICLVLQTVSSKYQMSPRILFCCFAGTKYLTRVTDIVWIWLQMVLSHLTNPDNISHTLVKYFTPAKQQNKILGLTWYFTLDWVGSFIFFRGWGIFLIHPYNHV